VAVDARRRRREDDAAIASIAHVGPGSVRDAEGSEDVDAIDEIPVLLLHLVKARIAQDARVVDDNVHASERIERALHDFLAVLYRVVIGNRVAPERLDLLDDLVGNG